MLDFTDTLYTNDDGKVERINMEIFDEPEILEITLHDSMIGIDNGGDYESKVLADEDIKIKQTKKSSGWYTGAFEASFKTSMKKKS